MTFFQIEGSISSPCPAQSPDLNPIENAWSLWKTKLEDRVIHTMEELWASAQQEWLATPIEYLNQLINSMLRRVEAVIAAQLKVATRNIGILLTQVSELPFIAN